MEIINIVTTGVLPLTVPLTIGLVEVVKRFGVNPRFLPLVSLLIGVGTTFLLNTSISLDMGILGGILTGLVASGLWSGVKHTLK